VRLGDTSVVCGVQAEILLARDIPQPPRANNNDNDGNDASTIAALHLLVPNTELATGCSPAHLPGSAPSGPAQALSSRILALLTASKLVRLADLAIYHRPETRADDDDNDADKAASKEEEEVVVAYWTLYISMHVLSLAGGASLFDAAWAAAVAALRDVRLPRARWDADVGAVVCSESAGEARRLRLRGRPLAATWGVFVADGGDDQNNEQGVRRGGRAWVLADPDAFEDELCKEVVTLVVDCSVAAGETRVVMVEKSGGAVVGAKQMRELVARAEGRWKEWDAVLP